MKHKLYRFRIGGWLVLLVLGAVLGRSWTWASGVEQPGNIAVFQDDLPVAGAASSPGYLAELLREAGFKTTFLNSRQLADGRELNHDRFDVLVLPYGASFPVGAAENFRRFLHEGGKFFSTGGYAFDQLLEKTTNGWRSYQPPIPPKLDGAAWFYNIPAAELAGRGRLTFRGFLKTSEVSGPGFAHFSVYQLARDGSLPTWRDLCQVRGSEDWKEYRFDFEPHPQAATVSLRAGLYRCRGAAWFDQVQLLDEAGTVLVDSDFERAADPDRQADRNWWRSHRELCVWQNAIAHSGTGALQAKLEFALPRVERLNTRHGRPEDGLEVEQSQLGIFQADYPLEHARFVIAAPMQPIIPPGLRWDGAVEGWAACGVVGWNDARWLPLLNACDRYGRLRGAAGAMLRHYAGPWRGSSWAYFGVTNRDLFTSEQPLAADAFVSVIRSLVRDLYFASLTTEQACYRQGESVNILIPVFNGGRQAQDLRIDLAIQAGEPVENLGLPRIIDHGPVSVSPALTNLALTVHALPGQTNLVRAAWSPGHFTAPFYHVTAHLWLDTHKIDQIESGFLAWDTNVVQSGSKLDYQDNYLRYGQRPLFLFGTDDWGYVFNTARETPLQWWRDMRQRRDLGVMIYENLQFGLPPPGPPQEQLLRKVDGLAQLAQQYGQVYFPGLLVGYNAAASEADLASQRQYCYEFARRYANVPGLIYYLNGDYRCELSDAVTPQWNDFLRARYGSDASLRQAWGRFASRQALGQIPAEDYHDWELAWDDVSAFDRNCFRAELLRRWNGALISGIRQADTNHPTSAEFYQVPHSGVDLPAGIDGLDLANFGFFEKPGLDLARFPLLCLYNDQRARGKSGGPGEYGVKTHPAWGDGADYGYHIARTREQAAELFLAIPHYALGLGASRIHNWCWKDDAHRVFPWGMVYPCDGVPKETAYVHRNLSLLFRHFAPVYAPPDVYVLTPDSHRLGGSKWKVIEGILTSLELALGIHPQSLGVLNEQGLVIPKSARAIFYPLPFCPGDEAYRKVLDWVKQGGVLYLSGDITYDEQRRRTRTARLEELCGARFISELYPNITLGPTNAADQPCLRVEPVGARVLRRTLDGSPLLLENPVGGGRVLYCTDPVELHSTPARRAQDLALYRLVLRAAGVDAFSLLPDDPLIHVMRTPLRDGGQVVILFNQDGTQPERTITLEDVGAPLTITVARHRPALAWRDGTGALRAVESHGPCLVNGKQIWHDQTGGAVLSLDGQDLPQSRAMLLMPLQSGMVRWQTSSTWGNAVIETGEFQGGRWQSLETQPIHPEAGSIKLQVSAEQALSLLLVCEQSSLVRWRSVLERALTDPGSLP